MEAFSKYKCTPPGICAPNSDEASSSYINDDVDWSKYDLNQDGVVDRFLILHTAKPQEDNGGGDTIWSHFGPLTSPIEVGGGLTIEHYTMASLRSSNYRGTIYHEMLHQFELR